jgi:hypothetical protein
MHSADDSGSESEGEIVVLPSQNGDEDGEGEDESLESHLNVEVRRAQYIVFLCASVENV